MVLLLSVLSTTAKSALVSKSFASRIKSGMPAIPIRVKATRDSFATFHICEPNFSILANIWPLSETKVQ